MSTSAGQSLLHPLQARHRSRASLTSSERQPSLIVPSTCPSSISKSRRDRPRVECRSSRVTWYDGQTTEPPSFSSLRHLPTPTHRLAAALNEPPSFGKAKCRPSGC